MAALDRLDDLEEFTLGLQPRDVFAPSGSGSCRSMGSTTTPGDARAAIERNELAEALAAAPIELIVFATDVSEHDETSY